MLDDMEVGLLWNLKYNNMVESSTRERFCNITFKELLTILAKSYN